MIYQLLDVKNNQVASGSFLDCKQVEGNLRAMGQTGLIVCADYEAMGYVFYKQGDKDGECAINEDFMLGFMLGLAEYPAHYKTIKEAFNDYFSDYLTNIFIDMIKRFKARQELWVRWPSLPLS